MIDPLPNPGSEAPSDQAKLLLDGLSEHAILSVSADERIQVWNPGAGQIFGYAPEEIAGQPYAALFERADVERGVPEDLLRRARQRRATFRGCRVRKDGSRFWAYSKVSAVRSGADGIAAYVEIACDTTEERAGGEALARSEEEVRRLNHELRERIINLDAFAATVAHDVASPLRAVTTYTELVLEAWGCQAPPEAAEDLRRVLAAARHMRSLVEDLLTYSRLAHEELRLEPLDLVTLVEEVILSMAHMLGESAAKVDLVKPFPTVRASAVPLRQALTNLISNAVKFVKPGAAPVVRISSERRGSAVRLVVEDRGIGIGPEDAKRLFQPFERITPGGPYPGSGLGLAIVRRAAERMGGRVGMDPVEGGGCRFWVELPAA
jgi:PAS domain S-box-containing protein